MSAKKRDARFAKLFSQSALPKAIAESFDELVTAGEISTEFKNVAMVSLKEKMRSCLLDAGVPEGFLNNSLLLCNYNKCMGLNPPLNCMRCGDTIHPTRDYSCNSKKPLCFTCS